jgi:hypothetical protein
LAASIRVSGLGAGDRFGDIVASLPFDGEDAFTDQFAGAENHDTDASILSLSGSISTVNPSADPKSSSVSFHKNFAALIAMFLQPVSVSRTGDLRTGVNNCRDDDVLECADLPNIASTA